MGTRKPPRTHFLSSSVIENVDEVLVAMEGLAIWPCLVTLSLAGVLQGAEANTTLAPSRKEETTPKAKNNTIGFLELCCIEKKLCSGNMDCIGCLCRCPLNHSYKSKTGMCEAPVIPTIPPSNTSSNSSLRRSGNLPGEPCINSSACVEGLVCVKYKCQCPEPCEYLSEQLACDCGAADNVALPAIVGMMVGMVIVAFWWMCISSSVKSHMEERNKVMQLNQQQVPRISTLGAAYGTDHLSVPASDPSQVSPASTAVPSPLPTPAPLRLSRQAVAPTPPPQPVFRPQSPPTSTYHFNPSLSPSAPYITPPYPQRRDSPFPYLLANPTDPLLPSPSSAPLYRRYPPLQGPPDVPPPPPWVDHPRSARF